MAVRMELSQEIDRPVPTVFKFYADDHVRNHPRWDPDIELWRTSDEPIEVGTIIQRRNSRSGTTAVEGTMEVVEYEPNRAFGVLTREGPMETHHGRATFEEVSEGRTRLTIRADMPIDESMKDRITGDVQRSVRNIKELIGQKRSCQRAVTSLIHPTAGKRDSANFACKVLGSSAAQGCSS
jgi:hypothetical protein